MIEIAIGLGSNLGDRFLELQVAHDALATEGTVSALSSVYATEPWGGLEQPSFLNAVLLLKTSLSPEELLERCHHHELKRGRERSTRWGARPIDCDLLLAGNLVCDTKNLILPHPRLPERRFVLVPLAEVAPDMRHPLLSRTVQELLDHCRDEGRVERTPLSFCRPD